MKRNFAKKRFDVNGEGMARLRWVLFACIFAALCCGGAFFIYQQKQAPDSSGISVYFARIKTWIAERKNRLHQDVTKTKQVVVNKNNTEPQIHFEFYTALPNMQVTVSESNVKSESAVKSGETMLQTAEKTSAHNTAPIKKIMVEKSEKPMPASVSASIINAEELEQEFAKQIKQIAYVVQLGAFKSSAAAERYKRSLVEAGLSATMIKVFAAGKEIYHVQFGPFSNKNQAKLAQQQLQKQGITGLIRRMTA